MKKLKSKLCVVMSLLLAMIITTSVQAAPKTTKKPPVKKTKAVTKSVVKPTEKLSTSYYTSKAGGYKIKFPANWKVEEDNDEDINTVTASSKDGMTEMIIGSLSGVSGITLDEAMSTVYSEFIKETLSDLKNLKQVKKQKVKIAGNDAYWIEYTGLIKEEGMSIKVGVNVLATVNGDKLHLAFVMGGGPKWSRNVPIYKQSIMSIILDKNMEISEK